MTAGLSAVAQPAKSVSKIILKYSKGHYSWGETGVYSRGEIFEILPVDESSFRIIRYFKITGTKIDSDNFKKDTIQIGTDNCPLISKGVIDSLYIQLNTTETISILNLSNRC